MTVNHSGKQFGNWTVGEFSHQRRKINYYHFSCSCGTKQVKAIADFVRLDRPHSLSCGCLRKVA